MVISVYYSTSRECYVTGYDYPRNIKNLIGEYDSHNRLYLWCIDLNDLSYNKRYFPIRVKKIPLIKALGKGFIKIGNRLYYGKKNAVTVKYLYPWWYFKGR